ncbi:MAG: preprotein translocase subunit SecG [Oscillospiraceae bacterium]|nr:preprotein translocase subunit SecG [Oscillospiraceae bacterium]
MNIMEIICGIVLILAAVGIIALTSMQENQGKGLSGAIMGGSDPMAAGRARSNEAKMAQMTKILGIVFVVVTLLVSVISVRLG